MEKHEIERIISLYSDSVLKTAFSYVKNTCDAQDIAQDVVCITDLPQKAFHVGRTYKSLAFKSYDQ